MLRLYLFCIDKTVNDVTACAHFEPNTVVINLRQYVTSNRTKIIREAIQNLKSQSYAYLTSLCTKDEKVTVYLR